MPAFARDETRAAPPKAPPPSPALLKAQAEWETYRKEREGLERRSVLRGSILLALLVALVGLLRAGADRAFPSSWMHRW